MRSTGLVSRKVSSEPAPNTTGNFSLSFQIPSLPCPADMAFTCSATTACLCTSMNEYRAVAGIRTATIRTISLTLAGWVTNQSCTRLAAFLMASQSPVEAGGLFPVSDRFDMALFRGPRYAIFRAEHVITITPDREFLQALFEKAPYLAPAAQFESISAREVPVGLFSTESHCIHLCASVPRICAGKGTIATRIVAMLPSYPHERGNFMNNIVYIVGLVVIVIAILSFIGLR